MSGAVLSLQRLFQQHMLGEGDASVLMAGSTAQRQRGLGIYAHAYRARLLDTLADAYPSVRAMMGAGPFEAAALAHIAAQPPTTRSLRWYGDRFSEHLARHHTEQPGYAELARLDWALRQAFDGPDAEVLEAATLSLLPPETWATVRLQLVPTTQLHALRGNTVAVWQALNAEEPPPAWDTTAAQLDWLIWRKGLQPHFRSVSPLEATLLRAMLEGHAFADCCARAESMCESTGEPAANMAALIGGFLQQWLAEQVLDANSLSTQTLQP